MKEYSKLFIFVIVLGLLVSGIYLGMTTLTSERIIANQLFELKNTTLAHNNANTSGGIDQTFEDDVTVLQRNGYTFYLYKANENNTTFESVSIVFTGDGLWGSIMGIVTFESDFVTIRDIDILEQEETPGLGGKITTRKFLDVFIGKKMDPELLVNNGKGENEVDAIIGATGTSNQMQSILNSNYRKYHDAFYGVDPEIARTENINKSLLFNLGIEYTDLNYEDLVASNVVAEIHEGLTIYTSDNTISYIINGPGLYGLIEGVITFEEDFETIKNIAIFQSSEQWGAAIVSREYLDTFIGKKFIDGSILIKANPTGENEVDIIAGATATTNAVRTMLNSSYAKYKAAYSGIDPAIVRNQIIQKTILFNNDINYDDNNFTQVFNSNIEVIEESGLTFYLSSDSVSYLFSGEGGRGLIEGIMTLSFDYETIINVSVFESSEIWGNKIEDRSYLNTFVGKKFVNNKLTFIADPTGENQVDVVSGPTTSVAFPKMINDSYVTHKEPFVNINPVVIRERLLKQTILFNNNIAYTDLNFEDLFNDSITVQVYDDLTFYLGNDTISYLFSGQGGRGFIEGLMTVQSDFVTIVNVSVFESSEIWGNKIEDRAYLNTFVGKKFVDNKLTFITNPNGENEVDVVSGPTTSVVFPNMINNSYATHKVAYDNNHISDGVSNYINLMFISKGVVSL